MAAITATVPAADARTIWLALDGRARGLRDAARAAARRDPSRAASTADDGIDAYRADALTEWAAAALAAADAPTRQGRRPQIQVVIDLPSLLGLADNPAELLGYGPIPASVARCLATDADWRRFVVEPGTGYLIDYGSVVYRPPQALADFIVARDRHCRFPGCTRAAVNCDIDHVKPAPRGPTSAANLATLCRRHHRLKTHGGWRFELLADGTSRWTTPNGRRRFIVDAPAQLERYEAAE